MQLRSGQGMAWPRARQARGQMVGAMLAVLSGLQMQQARADEANVMETPAQLAAAGSQHHFAIPKQNLNSAMAAFALVSGMQFLLDERLGQGLTSPGLQGDFTNDQALRQLLTGTGLTFRYVNDTTVTLEKMPMGAETPRSGVQVTSARGDDTGTIDTLPPAYSGGQVATGGQAGLLGNRDIMDTPFTTTNYTEKTVKDQQARSLADVIDNDPSVRNIWSRSSYTDQYMIRGFPVYNDDVAFNDLYGILPRQKIAAEHGRSATRLQVRVRNTTAQFLWTRRMPKRFM